jgi:hypothetical protein
MDLSIGAGPQFTHTSDVAYVCDYLGIPVQVPASDCSNIGGSLAGVSQAANHTGIAGRVSIRYRFPKTSVSLSYNRFNTSGSGLFAGSRSDMVVFAAQRPLSRVWDAFGDVGYAKNSRLQLGGSTVNANSFTYVYAGAGLHRQFGRNFRGFVSYQFNHMSFDTSCPVGATIFSSAGTVGCSNASRRQVGSIGLDWTPRPIQLD